MPNDSLKRCSDCQELKLLEEFGRDAARPDGMQFYCKACCRRRSAESYRRRRRAEGRDVRPTRSVPDGFKYCPGCQRVLPHRDFTKHRQQAGGLASYCRVCKAARDRAARFLKVYGLTLEERDAMIEAQGGVCAICAKHEAVHVDHDHVTGAVRGVLCFWCNAALGQVADSSETLRRMIDYIERTS